MKAMSQTMYLVVAAIIIMVTAVVVIAIFWQGITPAIGLTEAASLCQTQATISCTSMNQMPPTWYVQNMKTTRGTLSCADLVAGGCGNLVIIGTGDIPSNGDIPGPISRD